MAIIEIYFHHLIFCISQKYSNILKNVLCMEKSAVSQAIILNKSAISLKKSLVTVILNIRSG